MARTSVLPDPTHKVNTAMQTDPAGTAGPGYAGVKVSSIEPMMKFRSNSKRYERDSAFHHRWKVDIAYNPLDCPEFHLIYSFINANAQALKPILVSVPPYSSQVLAGISAGADGARGDSSMLVTGTGVQQGMIFNFIAESKIYQVTRVETETVNDGNSPGAGNERLHFTPPLTTTIANTTGLNFTDPLFQVMPTGADMRYSINKDGLFELSLSFQEVIK